MAVADSKASGRATPSTPRRLRSAASTPDLTDGSSVTSSNTSRIPPVPSRSNTPSQPPKIRAAISAESRIRKKGSNYNISVTASAKRSAAGSPVPSSPSRFSRPVFVSHNNDPEASLVDWKKVDEGDVSIDLDDDLLLGGAGESDKVLVSVRLKPADEGEMTAWISEKSGLVKLDPAFARTGVVNAEHHYDNVLTGSANKPIYNATARSHVRAAMEGYNAVVFAYGQTASGKTFTLSGSETEPGIIPRAMRDVFTYIRNTPEREFLLRASYLEIYKEQIHDLLSPSCAGGLALQDNGVVPGLREEVVMSVKGLKEVLERGEANRRTASTDWNSRSSRSHSVFRLIIESREVGSSAAFEAVPHVAPGGVPSTPGGSRLQAKGGRSVQMSTLSLIDLAGSERATSDKERTNEGKYINQSLLTLGTVIGTLAENASKQKKDFVPFRNSKLTKLLQPSLSGNARISVICTLNPAPGSISESTSTLQFASRVKKVHLHATRKEIVDTDALIERYRKEIEDLKSRLSEREREVSEPTTKRRLSAREKLDENRAMNDLNSRIKQLTKLILTSQTVEEARGDESRPVSPCKLDFDLTPFQLQEQLLSAKRTIDSQANQILSLEATLSARPLLPPDAPETEKDRLIEDLSKTVKELEIVTRGYEENLGAPLRQVKEDVEREWKPKVEELEQALKDKTSYIEELEKALEKEKQTRAKFEQEKLALIGFVREIDTHMSMSAKSGLMTPSSSIASNLSHSTSFRPTLSPLVERTQPPPPPPTKLPSAIPKRLTESPTRLNRALSFVDASPMKINLQAKGTSLLEEDEVEFLVGDISEDVSFSDLPVPPPIPALEDKENIF